MFVLNAMLAIGVVVGFPITQDSLWVWMAVVVPRIIILLTLAFQSA